MCASCEDNMYDGDGDIESSNTSDGTRSSFRFIVFMKIQ